MEPAAFFLTEPVFYDAIATLTDPRWDRRAPDGWQRVDLRHWIVCHPIDVPLPAQGWKIHVSACPRNADDVFDAAWDHCIARGIAFKFLRNRDVLLFQNEKGTTRSASGKFVTIYPADEVELEAVLTELGCELDGQPGPYILSDLRWGAGPLHVRYGGFRERFCLGPNGEPHPGISDDEGNLVPDRRDPTFSVPPWVTLPAFLEPHLAARRTTSLADLPYRIERALHFSNAGGIYAGVDRRTGAPVVLKEARPYAAYTDAETDAVSRLHREQRVLEQLAGLSVVPALLDTFVLDGHHFLVQEHVDGTNLSQLMVQRYPLTTEVPDAQAVAEYTEWALDVLEHVEGAVAEVHGRDIVIGDLNPANVLVRPDGQVTLVDWEVAASTAEATRPTLGAPGFAAPPDVDGFDIDRYALACLRLHLFLPLTRLLVLDPGKVDELAATIASEFPVAPEQLASAVRTIAAVPTPPSPTRSPPRPPCDLDRDGWESARDSMAAAIRSSATPHREDRLFPGGVEQFARAGGIDFANGAAGVLYALDAAGAGRVPEHEDWLVTRADRAPGSTPIGLFDGLLGIAYVLERLGRADDAWRLVDRSVEALDDARSMLGLGLASGLSGIALALAHFATAGDDPSLGELAAKLGDEVASRVCDAPPPAAVSGGDHPYAGLWRGSSGPALLAVRLAERTEDAGWLDVAATALRQDLRRCVDVDGALAVAEGWRTMPYLGDGSAGIGMVLAEYLQHRDDQQFVDAIRAIRRAVSPRFCIASGLVAGRAGLLLASGHLAGPGAAEDPRVRAHLELLSQHALGYHGHLAFPGDGLLRLSMDLSSGTAGVLLAVASVLHEQPAGLPFLASAGAVP